MRGLQAEAKTLTWSEQPIAELSDGQIRVRVKAAGLNRADLLQRLECTPHPRE